MTLDDLRRVVGVNSSGHWTKTSAAILEMLRQFAREGRMREFAEAYRLALDAHPDATAFLSHAVVVVLLSAYQPLHQAATPAEFATWCEANPQWCDGLRLAALNPEGITTELDRLTALVRDHTAR